MSILAESRPIPGDSKEDGGEGGPWFLVLYQEEWAAVFQVEGDPIPGNSSGVTLGTNSPEGGGGDP